MSERSITEERLDELAERANRCVCRYCGSPLEVRLLVFSSVKEAGAEIFCPHCNRIEHGVEPEIYQNAKYYADTLSDTAFLDENAEQRCSIICDIMTWNDMRLGFLTERGFVYNPIMPKEQVDRLDGSVIYTLEDER